MQGNAVEAGVESLAPGVAYFHHLKEEVLVTVNVRAAVRKLVQPV